MRPEKGKFKVLVKITVLASLCFVSDSDSRSMLVKIRVSYWIYSDSKVITAYGRYSSDPIKFSGMTLQYPTPMTWHMGWSWMTTSDDALRVFVLVWQISLLLKSIALADDHLWPGGGAEGGNFRNEFIFSQEPLPYKFFSWRRASKIFFLDYLWSHPQIINGRPLSVLDDWSNLCLSEMDWCECRSIVTNIKWSIKWFFEWAGNVQPLILKLTLFT